MTNERLRVGGLPNSRDNSQILTKFDHYCSEIMWSSYRHRSILWSSRGDPLRTVHLRASTATVSVKYETKLGQSVKLVGNINDWDANRPDTQMTWGEGHIWSREVTAPENSIVEFKLVVTSTNGQAQWEGGDNRVITFPPTPLPTPMQITCTFGNTKATEVLVPAVAAPAPDHEISSEVPSKVSISAEEISSAEAAALSLAQAERLVQELAVVKEEVLKKIEKVDPSPLTSFDQRALEAAISKAEAAPETVSLPAVEEEGSPVIAFVAFAALAIGGAAFLYLNEANPSDSLPFSLEGDLPTIVSAFSELGSSLSSKADSLVAVVNDQMSSSLPYN